MKHYDKANNRGKDNKVETFIDEFFSFNFFICHFSYLI